MTRHAVLHPPTRWTEDERPGAYQVIRSHDDGDTWHAFAMADDINDALDIAAMLDELEQRRAD